MAQDIVVRALRMLSSEGVIRAERHAGKSTSYSVACPESS